MHPTSIRAFFELVKEGKKEKSALVKERVMDLVQSKLLPCMDWDEKQTSSLLKTSNYDVADAILAGILACHMHKETEAAKSPDGLSAFRAQIEEVYGDRIDKERAEMKLAKKLTGPGIERELDARILELHAGYILKARPPLDDVLIANNELTQLVHYAT